MRDMRVHCIQTGSATMSNALRALRAPERLHPARILLDRSLAPAMPVLCWLIEHPEGLIMVDTGELAAASDVAFFANDRDYRLITKHLRGLRFSVRKDDEVGAQLLRMGINPRKDIRKVVLTHLHSDHADGLRFFPNADIVIARQEFAQPHAFFPATWPIWFRPSIFDFANTAYGAFAQSHALTEDGAVLAVPTPGHSHGHISVIVRGTPDLFIAGDVTYDAAQLAADTPSGRPANLKIARETLTRVRAHLDAMPSVYLPSHDPESPARLASGQ
jgi:N-acyl homoserine lactone hydrolase